MRVRAAHANDYEAWLKLVSHVGAGGTPTSRERYESGIAPNAIFLEHDGALVGYALSFVFGTRGDVRQISVAPQARKRGIGKLLMTEVRAKLMAGGCRDWRLEVVADNAPAIALYRSVGMELLAEMRELFISNEVRTQLVQPGVVTPVTDDAQIEARWDLGRGQLQRWRSFRPNARFLQIADSAFAQFIDDFAEDHGLMFPVFATDADHVASLLSAVRDRDYEVAVTRALSEPLIARGARLVRDSFIFGGRID